MQTGNHSTIFLEKPWRFPDDKVKGIYVDFQPITNARKMSLGKDASTKSLPTLQNK